MYIRWRDLVRNTWWTVDMSEGYHNGIFCDEYCRWMVCDSAAQFLMPSYTCVCLYLLPPLNGEEPRFCRRFLRFRSTQAVRASYSCVVPCRYLYTARAITMLVCHALNCFIVVTAPRTLMCLPRFATGWSHKTVDCICTAMFCKPW